MTRAQCALIDHTARLYISMSLRVWRMNDLKHSFADIPTCQSVVGGWLSWYDHDKLHRAKGPATIDNGIGHYYMWGMCVSSFGDEEEIYDT